MWKILFCNKCRFILPDGENAPSCNSHEILYIQEKSAPETRLAYTSHFRPNSARTHLQTPLKPIELLGV